MGYRQPLFTIAVGSKGIGKTYTTEKIIDMYVKGNASLGIKPRKVLILDINGEYTKYKTIPVEHVFDPKKPNWILAFSSKRNTKYEARRIICVDKKGHNYSIEELNLILEYIIRDFHGGLLVVEDTARYVADSVNRDLTGGLATIRHRNCDVIAHFQWKSKALNPKIFGNANLLRIHKTNDDFISYKNTIKGQKEILYLAEYLVRIKNKENKEREEKNKNRNNAIPIETYYCYVDFDKTKITGNYTEKDFKNAIELYLSQEKNALAFYLKMKNTETGKPKYTYKEAYQIKEKELFEEYYYENKANKTSDLQAK